MSNLVGMEDELEIINDVQASSNHAASIPSLKEEGENPLTATTPKKLVYMEGVYKGLEIAHKTGENIILYGRGGFSKSLITEQFFKAKGITPYIKTLGGGTTIDSLYGGMDINLFMHGEKDEDGNVIQKSGKIEYLVENSFMNHEYVVFEELFDAPEQVLEQLKDILTAKCFRNGTQVFPIKTKMIVCCTNKTRSEFSGSNDSLKALMERFVLECKVEWDNFSSVKYDYMFMESFGKTNKMLSYICEELNKEGTTVSPRTAVKCLFGMETSGIDFLSYVAEFNTKDNAKKTKEAIKKFKAFTAISEIEERTVKAIEELTTLSNGLTAGGGSGIESIVEINGKLKFIRDNIEKLDKMKKDDTMFEKTKGWITSWNKLIADVESKVKIILNA